MASDFERIFRALEEANVRYLVVGGVAVVLHGHPRFTADLDLVLSLEPENARRGIKALESLAYRSRAPVSARSFAEPKVRRQWVEEKGLTVFSLWSPNFLATEVDLFVEEPFDFEEVFQRSTEAPLGSTRAHLIAVPDLIALKRQAGRPKDVEDIRALQAITQEQR